MSWALAQGKILRLPFDVIGVPFEYRGGAWSVVVVGGTNPSYPVGGYHIVVSNEDIVASEVIDVDGETEADFIVRELETTLERFPLYPAVRFHTPMESAGTVGSLVRALRRRFNR